MVSRFPAGLMACVGGALLAAPAALAQQGYSPTPAQQGSAQAQQGYLAPTFEVLKPTIPELVGVVERPRPEYDAAGVHIGTFTWYPALESVIAYDDNIYATRNGTVGEWLGKVRPELRVKSNWNVHAFEAYGMVEGIGYQDNSADNQVNARLNANGVIDVTRDSRIRYYGDYSHAHEDRSISGLFNQLSIGLLREPVEFDNVSTGAAFDQKFNHTTVSVSGHYGHQVFQNNFNGSTPVDESFRNVDIYGTSLRLGQDIGPSAQAYVEGGYERHDYKLLSFNSDSYRLVGGFAGNISHLVVGDVFIGYQDRNYDQSVIHGVNDLTYGGALTWYVTPLMTAALFGQRTINESTFGAVGTFIQSQIGTRLDYEAMRNLILTGRFGFEWDDYNQVNRNDHVIAAGVTATYLLNRNAHVALDYRLTDRTSNLGGLNYVRDVVGATLRLQY